MALRSEDGSLTYRELNLKANKLARYLRTRGVGVEVLVGLCMERSIDAVVGLMAILKAGGAYVYLDPSYPAQRLRDIATDAHLPLIVTNTRLRSRIFDDTRPFVCLDSSRAEIAAENFADVESGVTPDNASYIIYTSGSTGRPKGAVEIHRSMTARLVAAPLLDIQEGDICSLNSSLGFGISASRLFLPLVCGSSVVILADDQVRDVEKFVQLLDANKVTSVFMVPALLRQVLALKPHTISKLGKLRAVTLSGGSASPELVENFLKAFPQAKLINNYGSSEIGTSAAMKVFSAGDVPGCVCIGRPVVNTHIYLLDEEMSQVPQGSVGEIYVGADHLAREYMNMPDLTAATFVSDPFGDGFGRMCRTGDLGRDLPNGDLEFLGRVDHQIKIRGYRVELGEIEAAPEGNERVSEVAVTANDAGSDTRLVAYLRPKQPGQLRVGELRRYLNQRLPEHMVPALFVFMDALPHTDAGKIDRQLLPSIDQCRPEVDTEYEAPRDAIEERLVKIWEDALEIEIVGVRDNFIELGGDSLTATQTLSRIETELKAKISLQFLFDESLGGIADAIRQMKGAKNG